MSHRQKPLARSLAVFVVMTLTSASLFAGRKAAVTSGAVIGAVRTVAGAPVPEAVVTVWDSKKKSHTQKASPAGDFKIDLKDGIYDIQAVAPHYAPIVSQRIHVVIRTGKQTFINLMMQPTP